MYPFTWESIVQYNKRTTLLFIVQLLIYRNPNIAIQIECLQKTKFLDPDSDLDRDLDNFALCKWGIILYKTPIE